MSSRTISPSDFEFVSRLVKDEAAIILDHGKEYLVQSRLDPVAKTLGFTDISSLITHLRTSTNRDLCRRVVESLTTHETSFFRDIEPFEALRTKIIPNLMETQKTNKEITIWCGAASSGQEPYSLCILLSEHFPELLTWKLRIVATDLSQAILKKAQSGKYSQIEVNRGLPIKYLVKYFEKSGQEWIVKPQIRSMIEYFEQNLLTPYVRIPRADLVMLRNVLIYFNIETKREILKKISGILKPDGFLFLGTAETTINIDDSYERVAFEKSSCYRKKGTT